MGRSRCRYQSRGLPKHLCGIQLPFELPHLRQKTGQLGQPSHPGIQPNLRWRFWCWVQLHGVVFFTVVQVDGKSERSEIQEEITLRHARCDNNCQSEPVEDLLLQLLQALCNFICQSEPVEDLLL